MQKLIPIDDIPLGMNLCIYCKNIAYDEICMKCKAIDKAIKEEKFFE